MVSVLGEDELVKDIRFTIACLCGMTYEGRWLHVASIPCGYIEWNVKAVVNDQMPWRDGMWHEALEVVNA